MKGANKDFKIFVGRSTTVHNLLFFAHTLCINYVTRMFLLVSSSVRSKLILSFVHGQGQKREQKHTTEKFVGFHNQSPVLTMVCLSDIVRRNTENR